jgi:hypothetical protein
MTEAGGLPRRCGQLALTSAASCQVQRSQPLMAKKPKTRFRYGIGEWYGKSFVELPDSARLDYAKAQFSEVLPMYACPFLSTGDEQIVCWKKGGVCSLRSYQKNEEGDVTRNERGSTVTSTCPSRFEERAEIVRWIGKEILGDENAVPLGQTPFLERVALIGGGHDDRGPREVGRIDNILVRPDSKPLEWCAVEIQAVYFSGKKMELHFREILDANGALVLPKHPRRPDYRSSAPKRLMPQLLIKVPTLRTWGKKMAVVVDEDFFKAMGRMTTVGDISNCEVAWFIVRFEDKHEQIRLRPLDLILTTLDSARDGLIAGRPPTLASFEQKIRERLR